MTRLHEPMTGVDFDAYVDDQLDAARRVEVEAFLAANPGAAARVMGDLRIRGELRLMLAEDTGARSVATHQAARRLGHGLARGRLAPRLRRAAAVGALVAAGWLAHEVVGPLPMGEVVASTPLPAYVGEAVRAHRTSAMRAAMVSQPEAPGYDPIEIRAATAIVMPVLPDSWRVTDVQVYPSQFGPSLEIAAVTPAFGPVSLFAVRPGTLDITKPETAHQDEATAAFFQVGEVAYALVADGDRPELEKAAARLAATLH